MIILSKIVLFAKLKKVLINFYIKSRECKQCNIKRVLKRYYDKREKIIQQRRDKCARFKDLDNRLKAMEEKLYKK